jgi:H+/Cl- antiporter ClcA
MADDLDPQLLRSFARAESALAEEPFVSHVALRMPPARGLPLGVSSVSALLGTVLASLASGIVLPLRMRQTRLMILGAAAMTICAAFF